MRIRPFHLCTSNRKSQHGSAILIILTIIGLGAAFLLVSALNKANSQIERDKVTYATLAQAKEALIGWTSVPRGSALGQLPLPDALAPFDPTFENPQLNYDGDSDQGCVFTTWGPGALLIASGATMRCLGRLPWRNLGMSMPSPSQNDPTGTMPWYAISGNLADICFQSSINPGILNSTYPGGYNCATAGVLPYRWLTVRDERGNVLSNRVAAVIIMPGPSIGGQTRPAAPLAGPASYLDALTVAGGCTAPCVPGNYNNARLNPGNDFIMGKDSRLVSATDPNYTQPYNFNDKLIYITIDELMAAAEKRAANEARLYLRNFYANSDPAAANRFYPFAATLGDPLAIKVSVNPNRRGFLPTPNCACTCTGGICTCNCSGTATLSVPAAPPTAQFTASTGACTRPAPFKTCVCNGTASGTCTSNAAVTSTNVSFQTITGPAACGTAPGTTCALPPVGTCACTARLPDWFRNNNWDQFLYYTMANSCTQTIRGCGTPPYLAAGSSTNLQALLIATGRPVANVAGQTPSMTTPPFAAAKGSAQTGFPSTNVNDYLDSLENANGNDTYDAVGTARSTIYNDQMIVVAP